jgi:hypothetical protein
LNSSSNKLKLNLLFEKLAVCRLFPDNTLPEWATTGSFWSILRSDSELSIICFKELVPDGIKCEAGWRAFKVTGTISFGLTGILASILNPLADAGISIFAISSYDTDYVLVKEENLEKTISVLTSAGHSFVKSMSDM